MQFNQHVQQKRLGLLYLSARASESLKNICDFHMKMKEKHLASNLLPAKITTSNNSSIFCPKEWL